MGARQSEVVRQAIEMYERRKHSTPHAIAKLFGISPSTLYRALKRRKERK